MLAAVTSYPHSWVSSLSGTALQQTQPNKKGKGKMKRNSSAVRVPLAMAGAGGALVCHWHLWLSGTGTTERISVCSELLQASSCCSVQTTLRTGADRIAVVNSSWLNPGV